MNQFLKRIPSPLSGLALAIASLGLAWESIVHLNKVAQISSSLLASLIVAILLLKYLAHPEILKQELQHPVAGSVLPTLSMAIMVIANSIAIFSLQIGQIVSWLAIMLHLFFLIYFIYKRANDFNIKQVLPSWFIPPIGIVLAIVTHPGGLPDILNSGLLYLGFLSYALLLPIVLYRLLFLDKLDSNQKPIITILAAPASLLLVAYLVSNNLPNITLLYSLLFVAILMTLTVYLALFNLLRTPFAPTYSAFTFPLVVSAIALIKTSHLLLIEEQNTAFLNKLLTQLGNIELVIASVMVVYVLFKYLPVLRLSISTTNNP
ncbi:TDT family transporter [Psychromonas sp.]|nr:TDT family transporter [Psychromonas sp.]